ncbi:MAG: prepilin-type N-terminal cleavage/methylation domain-containing protein [Pseudomonadota bacterium]
MMLSLSNRSACSRDGPAQNCGRGFSLVELLVAMAIAGLILAAAVPSSVRFYEGMQARQAVRTSLQLLTATRERAVASGNFLDVSIRPRENRIWNDRRAEVLPSVLTITVHGAAELNYDDTGVIRFYPDGSSSGGGVDVLRSNGAGTRLTVDWLLGRVTQQKIDSSA